MKIPKSMDFKAIKAMDMDLDLGMSIAESMRVGGCCNKL